MVADSMSGGILPPRLVVARDLSIRYRSGPFRQEFHAVRGLSFDVGVGEILGITGESGSGKSTLARTIAGLAGGRGAGVPQICGGRLEVAGVDLRSVSRIARDRLTLGIGYLAQDAATMLNSRLTVAENVSEPIYRRDPHFDAREAMSAVATVIDSAQLPLSSMDRLPWELSSGQRQRVALARALVLEPTLLVADEPTRGVDATARERLLLIFEQIREARDFSAIVISGDLAVLGRLSSQTAVMQRGIFVGYSTLDELDENANSSYLRQLARTRDGLSVPLRRIPTETH